jgi:hypothetical protein
MNFPALFVNSRVKVEKRNVKAIPVTGLGRLQGCEMLRIPHCLDSRPTGCQPYGPAVALLPRNNIYLLLVFTSIRG